MESIRRHLTEQAKQHTFPSIYYNHVQLNPAESDLCLEGYIGFATQFRKKHTDGKYYLSSFCDYYVLYFGTTYNPKIVTDLLSRFIGMTYSYQLFGKVDLDVNQTMWRLDFDQRDEHERMFDLMRIQQGGRYNPYEKKKQIRRRFSSSGNILLRNRIKKSLTQ